ncbi:Zinc finger protein ubi-d4 B [Armadillidium vulgare]|nr:Zinc finger protein ubi-d4 B [Armadillidium vulgare]
MTSTLIQSSTDKINSFLQDVQYHSLMVNSASFNVRLMRDRKTRLPFLDSQTGIAQSPCKLYMSSRHRMPGIHAGQLYAYPAQRWCRKKRSYLTLAQQAPEVYYYDEASYLEEEEEEPDNEDDDTYSTRATSGRKRKKGPKPKSTTRAPRGRKKREPSNYKIITDADDGDPGKPYECNLCGARYKTRQGLSYHLSHTHRTGTSGPPGNGTSKSTPPPSFDGNSNSSNSTTLPPFQQFQDPSSMSKSSDALTGLTEFQDSYLGFLSSNNPDSSSSSQSSGNVHRKANEGKMTNQEIQTTRSPINKDECTENSKDDQLMLIGSGSEHPPRTPDLKENQKAASAKLVDSVKEKKRATPNTYCDFCLGNTNYNVKTGEPEEMVSCADCGRSGHLTCLQFTPNMIISVRQYRWQCIECKCLHMLWYLGE